MLNGKRAGCIADYRRRPVIILAEGFIQRIFWAMREATIQSQLGHIQVFGRFTTKPEHGQIGDRIGDVGIGAPVAIDHGGAGNPRKGCADRQRQEEVADNEA